MATTVTIPDDKDTRKKLAQLRWQKEARMARQWLFENKPLSTEDASFRLMGLAWSSAPADEIQAAKRDLLAFQKPGGGWPQLRDYEPDAYSTGEALVALHEANSQVVESAFSKGLRFLISTQAPDGTWHVHTRMLSPADVSPKYFATGFPYGKDEFLSYAAVHGRSWRFSPRFLRAKNIRPARNRRPRIRRGFARSCSAQRRN